MDILVECEVDLVAVWADWLMKKAFMFSVFFGAYFYACAALGSSVGVVLVSDLSSQYEIVIERGASLVTVEAAKELRRLIKKSTNVELELVGEPSERKRSIFVGDSAVLRSSGLSSEGLRHDSFMYGVSDGNLYFLGNDGAGDPYFFSHDTTVSAGTYYGVLDFATNYLGAAWYMPTELGEEVRGLDSLSIPSDLKVRKSPRFGIRYLSLFHQRSEAKIEKEISRGRLRKNVFSQELQLESSRWARHMRLGNAFGMEVGHAWHKWIPAYESNKFSTKAYGDEYPEYFARPDRLGLNIYSGRLEKHNGQLCICDEGMQAEMARNMIAYSKKTGVTQFSLSPNDGNKWSCDCACCKSSPESYKKYTPELTDSIIKFAESVAGKVSAEVPDATFGLYAYSWYPEPPSSNVENSNITISDVYNGLPYIYSVQSEKENVERLAKGWREKTSSVVLTTYYTYYGHYSMPWSTPDVHSWLLGLLGEPGERSGLRLNYSQFDIPFVGALGPDPWVISQLLWSADKPVEQLYREYYDGAFTPEIGRHIEEYYALINMSMGAAIHESKFRGIRSVSEYIKAAYPPIRERCRELIDLSLSLAEESSEGIKWRVSRVANAWTYAELTMDMLDAWEKRDRRRLKEIKSKREKYISSKDAIYSIGIHAVHFNDSKKPLLN